MRLALSLFVTLFAAIVATAGIAHRGSECILVFRDGYFIEGWIDQDVSYSVEAHHVVKQSNGRLQLQVGPRETSFANRQVKDARKIDPTNPDKVVDLPPIRGDLRERMQAVKGVTKVSGWRLWKGKQLRRVLTVETATGEQDVEERLSELTPH